MWKCVGAESGTVFPDVDLEEGEWVDYDEKVTTFLSMMYAIVFNAHDVQAALPVGVSNIESKWARA